MFHLSSKYTKHFLMHHHHVDVRSWTLTLDDLADDPEFEKLHLPVTQSAKLFGCIQAAIII